MKTASFATKIVSVGLALAVVAPLALHAPETAHAAEQSAPAITSVEDASGVGESESASPTETPSPAVNDRADKPAALGASAAAAEGDGVSDNATASGGDDASGSTASPTDSTALAASTDVAKTASESLVFDIVEDALAALRSSTVATAPWQRQHYLQDEEDALPRPGRDNLSLDRTSTPSSEA